MDEDDSNQRLHTAEYVTPEGSIHALCAITPIDEMPDDEDGWTVYSSLAGFLVEEAGVLREWRRMNRAMLLHFLRCHNYSGFEKELDDDEYSDLSFEE